jgi:hypothetical protein
MRDNIPRIDRVLIAQGTDAVDVAISTAFRASILKAFSVITREETCDLSDLRNQNEPVRSTLWRNSRSTDQS